MAPDAANLFIWLASPVGSVVGLGVVFVAGELEAELVLLPPPTVEDGAALGLAVATELGVEAGVEARVEAGVEEAEVTSDNVPALEDEVVESVPLVPPIS